MGWAVPSSNGQELDSWARAKAAPCSTLLGQRPLHHSSPEPLSEEMWGECSQGSWAFSTCLGFNSPLCHDPLANELESILFSKTNPNLYVLYDLRLCGGKNKFRGKKMRSGISGDLYFLLNNFFVFQIFHKQTPNMNTSKSISVITYPPCTMPGKSLLLCLESSPLQ